MLNRISIPAYCHTWMILSNTTNMDILRRSLTMTLKKKRLLVFGSLFIQQLFTVFSSLIWLIPLPDWLTSAIILLIPYGIWLIQIFVGRSTGLTTAVSSSLVILSYLWNILINLNGYEMVLLPSFLFKLPLIILCISFVIGVYECYQSFKNEFTLVSKTDFKKEDKVSLSIAIALPIFTYYSGRIARMTLGYADQGIRPNIFSAGFLQYFTLPLILMILLATMNMIYMKRIHEVASRKVGSIVLFVSLLLLGIISAFFPMIFWLGVNPIIFGLILIFGTIATPKNYQNG